MSRYGDTPIGMVESAMEFLRIARDEDYHQIVLSMKSSNPLVMVQAYRLLVQKMDEEFGECYPLHLGVTEAGDGEDGRIKSAIGIGTLLEDGIGDTIRVSLTEDPEFEIPVCRDIVKRYANRKSQIPNSIFQIPTPLPYDPFSYKRRETIAVQNMGGHHVPVVVADYSNVADLSAKSLERIGYTYNEVTDKWTISDAAADYVYIGDKAFDIALPGTLQVISNSGNSKFKIQNSNVAIIAVDADDDNAELMQSLKKDPTAILVVRSKSVCALQSIRSFIAGLIGQGIKCPVILKTESADKTVDEQLIHFATDMGGLLLDGFGDGVWLSNADAQPENNKVSGRTYLEVKSNEQFLNNTAFSILQAARTRISKTEYISCPSCGRTLFDLQETTAKIRAATNHLKGVKIAIMGCIVNGPGEMADADFGYVGSGPGKITLYKGKEVVKRNVPSDIAVDQLIQLLKENEAWVEMA
jgi:(E)-4-hydroxy-3-methylbut-2-enyl-diphosphate synthase